VTEQPVRLLDVPGETGRTTVSLLGALAARLASLMATTGSDAVGSMTAGYAALGRSARRTTEGARLHAAIERSHVGANGEAVWRRLEMDRWASSLPPTAVLDQLFNDMALLVADDLHEVLTLPIGPAEPYGAADAPRPEPVEFADYLVGLWVFARSVVESVDLLLGDELADPPTVVEPDGGPPPDLGGPVLR
jgi:hypothetical protein